MNLKNQFLLAYKTKEKSPAQKEICDSLNIHKSEVVELIKENKEAIEILSNLGTNSVGQDIPSVVLLQKLKELV